MFSARSRQFRNAPGTAAGASDALQERRYGRRVVHLDDAIEVTNVDAQLQRRRGDDDTVASLGERLLRAAAFVDRQRRVRQVRGHAAFPQCGAYLLYELPGVAEDQALLSLVQRGDHRCGVAHRAHVVQLDIGRCRPALPRLGAGHRDIGLPGDNVRSHDNGRALVPAGALKPAQQFIRVADRGRQPDPLDGVPGDAGQALQHGEQVPAAVVTGEGVYLIDHDGPQIGEHSAVLNPEADEHGFQRLGRGQQYVRRLPQDPLPRRGGDVTVPDGDSPSQPARVVLQPGQQVIQQRLQGADVDDRKAGPALLFHRGQQGEDGCFGLAARSGRQEQRVRTLQHWANGLLLQRAQRPPAEAVDDVVDDDRMQPVKPRTQHTPMAAVCSVTAGRDRCRRPGPQTAQPPLRSSVPARTAHPPPASACSGGAGRSPGTDRPDPERPRRAS